MRRSELKSIIKQIIQEELLGEEQLEEISSTGAGGGYQSPNAFSGKGAGWKGDEYAADSMPNPDDRKSNVVDDDHPDKLTEARARYYNFRNSSAYKRQKSKVSFTIREMKKMLDEVNYLADITLRLKTEAGVDSSKLWRRTVGDLSSIQSSANSIIQKTKKLK